MLLPIRAVSPVVPPRCPQCHCFVRLDAGTCTACGLPFALASGSRRGENASLGQSVFLDQAKAVEGAASQIGPKGDAHHFSNLQPDGKIRRRKIVENLEQLGLFQGVL